MPSWLPCTEVHSLVAERTRSTATKSSVVTIPVPARLLLELSSDLQRRFPAKSSLGSAPSSRLRRVEPTTTSSRKNGSKKGAPVPFPAAPSGSACDRQCHRAARAHTLSGSASMLRPCAVRVSSARMSQAESPSAQHTRAFVAFSFGARNESIIGVADRGRSAVNLGVLDHHATASLAAASYEAASWKFIRSAVLCTRPEHAHARPPLALLLAAMQLFPQGLPLVQPLTAPVVKRLPKLTPDRRPILTPLCSARRSAPGRAELVGVAQPGERGSAFRLSLIRRGS